MDGRYSNKDLLEKIMTNMALNPVRKNYLDIDALVLDECSMLSAREFEQLEFIARNLRSSRHPFGSMQIILAGDFRYEHVGIK